MNSARLNHARLSMVAWRAFRQWVEPGPLNQARSHFNRMLKKSFSVEKTCKKLIVLVGRYPDTAIFQQPVKWLVVGHLKMLTVGIVEYLKKFSGFAYLKILLAYTTCFVASNGLAPAYGQVNNAPELYYFVIDKSRSIVENRLEDPIRGAVIDFVGRRSPETHVEIVFFSDSATKPRRWRSMDLQSKGAFSQYFFDNFKPAGGTRLYDTVAEVIGRVAAEAGQYRQINVIILSDGDDSTTVRRYRDWAALCELISRLRIDPKTTSFAWYTLGYVPKDKPPPDCLIKHFSVPDPSQVKIAEPPPAAAFTASPMKVRVGESVLFVLDNETGVSHVRWSFGDGAASRDLRPRHAFQQTGKYDVTVQVEGPGGRAESQPGTSIIEVFEEVPLGAGFKWSPRVVRVGEEVTLVDESLGSPTSWEWKVSGLGTRTERNPVVKFAQSGTHSVELVIEKDGKRASVKQGIDVLPQPPDARFSVEPMEPEVGAVLKLRATTTGPAYRHRWTMADVTLPSEKAAVEWKVDRHGRIEIVHAVEGPGGLTEKESVVFVPLPLEAKFSWQPTVPHVGEPVSLRDESTGDPATWSWEIQGVGKKSERHPTIVFASEGEFTVKLTVEKNGRTPSFLTRTIKVSPKLVKPDASFVATPRIFTVGTKIQLTASHDHAGWKHEWTIDKTNKFFGPKVEWTATRAGEVFVVHRVTSAEGTDEKTEILLGKTEIPVAKFSATPLRGIAPLQVQFKNESSGEIVGYEWDFGDGHTSTQRDPVHTYRLQGASKGEFSPTLTVRNRAGDMSKNTELMTIVVEPPPPWWELPAKAGGVLFVIAMIVWILVRNPRRSLYGTLRWEFHGQSGTKVLAGCGKTLDLADLAIKGCQIPRGQCMIQNTRRDGMHVKRTDGDPIPLANKTKFKLKAADFEYRES